MKDLIRFLYRWKIKLMFYFGLGYGEVSNVVSMVKDIVIIIGFAVLVLKIHLGIEATILTCVGAFCLFTLIGVILKKSGMSDYQNRLNNSINPEIKMIPQILNHLKGNDNEQRTQENRQ